MTILTVYKNTAFGPSVYAQGDKLEDARNYYNESVQLWDRRSLEPNISKEWKKECEFYARNGLEALETLQLMEESEFLKMERDYYLKQPPKEVTESDYWDALEALMPLRMTNKGFQMREFKTGPYTSEYYKEKGKFYCHVVDAYDPTTWKI